jgi:nitroreductase
MLSQIGSWRNDGRPSSIDSESLWALRFEEDSGAEGGDDQGELYDPAGHDLVRLPGRVRRGGTPALLAHQPYFRGCAALVVMAPVFARTMWRYPSSRAYRAVLIEAGHLCQTFCLVATALKLAPFSTFAFSERDWERILGLDGIGETPVYIAGVGARPADGLRPGALEPRLARKVAR